MTAEKIKKILNEFLFRIQSAPRYHFVMFEYPVYLFVRSFASLLKRKMFCLSGFTFCLLLLLDLCVLRRWYERITHHQRSPFFSGSVSLLAMISKLSVHLSARNDDYGKLHTFTETPNMASEPKNWAKLRGVDCVVEQTTSGHVVITGNDVVSFHTILLYNKSREANLKSIQILYYRRLQQATKSIPFRVPTNPGKEIEIVLLVLAMWPFHELEISVSYRGGSWRCATLVNLREVTPIYTVRIRIDLDCVAWHEHRVDQMIHEYTPDLSRDRRDQAQSYCLFPNIKPISSVQQSCPLWCMWVAQMQCRRRCWNRQEATMTLLPLAVRPCRTHLCCVLRIIY